MRVVLLEPDAEVRGELVESLQRCGIAVSAFADPRMALLFALGRLGELDGVLVNGQCGWPAWLRRRLEMLPAAPRVLTYSGSHPEREARIAGGVPRIGRDVSRQGLLLAVKLLGARVASVGAAGRSGPLAARG